MNARERFLAVMRFKDVDRTLNWEMDFWVGAVRRWYKEGLPRKDGIPDSVADGEGTGACVGFSPERGDRAVDSYTRRDFRDIKDYFHFDAGMTKIPVKDWVYPFFERKILEEDEENITYVDGWGCTKKDRKDHLSAPEFIDWPVKDFGDFERLKERFIPDVEKRVPKNWSELVQGYKTRDYPLAIGGAPLGFFHSLRYLMGFEGLCLAYHEKPKLLKNIAEFLTTFWIALWDKILPQVEVDVVSFCEDMAYKTASMISPALCREFIMPYYKRIITFFKDWGVDIFLVDSDGNVNELIPLFMECGVTGMFPFEVQAGMDIVKVREQYPRLAIIGGIDKTKIAKGKNEIDRELEIKVPFMLKRGGYVPVMDHGVPPDISWENYVYYRTRLKEMIDNFRQG